MYWRKEQYRDTASMTFNQTYTLDLPASGRLASIYLYLRSTETASGFPAAVKWRLLDYISKIEVIPDGGDPIKSNDGMQTLANAYYDDGVLPPSMWRSRVSIPHRQFIPIHFGRRARDPYHYLDLSKYNRVQLKITNTATASEFTTDIQLDVFLEWIEEPVVPSLGFFKDEEWVTFNAVAAKWEYNKLPTEYPIRRILLRGRPGVDTADAVNNSSIGRLFDDINFRTRSGNVVLYRGDLLNLAWQDIMRRKRYAEVMAMISRTAGYGFETSLGYVMHAVNAPGYYSSEPATFPASIMEPDSQDSTQVVRAQNAFAPNQGLFRGYGFGHCVPVYDSDSETDQDLLDPDREKTVLLDFQCQSGTTVSGTDHVATQAIILSRLIPS